jgi:hypothetical protein
MESSEAARAEVEKQLAKIGVLVHNIEKLAHYGEMKW